MNTPTLQYPNGRIKSLIKKYLKNTKFNTPIARSLKEIRIYLKHRSIDTTTENIRRLIEDIRPTKRGFILKVSRGLIVLYYMERRFEIPTFRNKWSYASKFR